MDRALALLHRDPLREVFRRRDGTLWIVSANDDPDEAAVELALADVEGALTAWLTPWRCRWCGGVAELPDACARCALALSHYDARGARYAMGHTCIHTYRDLSHTSCGIGILTLPDRRPVTRREIPVGTLCRRCLRSLVIEHEAFEAARRERPRRG
jgi:hypothetical protein